MYVCLRRRPWNAAHTDSSLIARRKVALVKTGQQTLYSYLIFYWLQSLRDRGHAGALPQRTFSRLMK